MVTTLQNSTTDHRIWYRLLDDVVFLVPEGAGDQACAEELDGVIDNLRSDGHKNFILDLSHLRYVETPGFRLISNKLCELQKVGGMLVVTGLRGAIARAFSLLKFDQFVPVAKDVQSAIKLAKRPQRAELLPG